VFSTLRGKVQRYLEQLVSAEPGSVNEQVLEQHASDVMMALVRGVADPTVDARTAARRAFVHAERRWPERAAAACAQLDARVLKKLVDLRAQLDAEPSPAPSSSSSSSSSSSQRAPRRPATRTTRPQQAPPSASVQQQQQQQQQQHATSASVAAVESTPSLGGARRTAARSRVTPSPASALGHAARVPLRAPRRTPAHATPSSTIVNNDDDVFDNNNNNDNDNDDDNAQNSDEAAITQCLAELRGATHSDARARAEAIAALRVRLRHDSALARHYCLPAAQALMFNLLHKNAFVVCSSYVLLFSFPTHTRRCSNLFADQIGIVGKFD
jgi:hypothetical protein